MIRDLSTLIALARPGSRHPKLRARLEQFYAPQASHYDAFRERLLHGRKELIGALDLRADSVWVDLGGGTAANLRHTTTTSAAQVLVVDLTRSLLDVARARKTANGWTNVSLVQADATQVPLPSGQVDIVTCSYSLTMMPDWFAVIDEARRLLKPGGTIAVVDFYVSRATATPLVQHGAATRWFWPWWFAHSQVHPNPDHLPYLQHRFTTVSLVESRGPLPYLPLVRAPYYRFIGRKATAESDCTTEWRPGL